MDIIIRSEQVSDYNGITGTAPMLSHFFRVLI